jgi:hypothetical protein
MAITKTVTKKVYGQAIVKFVGDGTSNVDLYSDIKLSDETVTAGNLNVTINSITYSNGSSSNPILVYRNNTLILQLFGNDNWYLAQSQGFSDGANASANIVVIVPSPGGTVYLGLTKTTGYTTTPLYNRL